MAAKTGNFCSTQTEEKKLEPCGEFSYFVCFPFCLIKSQHKLNGL